MARDYGAFYYSAWNDMDFRRLPDPAQSLYFKLVVHPSLSWAGVGDWRPGRIATMSQGLDSDDVRHVADCLIARHYIVVDDETEEFLVRTYLKHDGIMGHAKLSVSMAKAFANIGSNDIRMVLSDELHKLRESNPELCGWGKPQVIECLDTPRLAAGDRPTPEDPFSNGFRYAFRSNVSNLVSLPQTKTQPSVKESVKESPTPYSCSCSIAPCSCRPTPVPRGSRLPEDWQPGEELMERGAQAYPRVDLEYETQRFADYWQNKTGKDATKLSWDRAWQTWMLKAEKDARAKGRPIVANMWEDEYGNTYAFGDNETSDISQTGAPR